MKGLDCKIAESLKKMSKDKNIEVLNRINKAFGDGAIMQLGAEVDRKLDVMTTGSIKIDAATGCGGIPKGCIVELYGKEGSGKTSLAMQIPPSMSPARRTFTVCVLKAMLWYPAIPGRQSDGSRNRTTTVSTMTTIPSIYWSCHQIFPASCRRRGASSPTSTSPPGRGGNGTSWPFMAS